MVEGAIERVNVMAKIPRGLTDKDMVKNYIEEQTIEDKLVAAEKEAEQVRAAQQLREPPKPLAQAGFTAELADKLGRELLALKMELGASGVKNYNFKTNRDGEKITLTVVNKTF